MTTDPTRAQQPAAGLLQPETEADAVRRRAVLGIALAAGGWAVAANVQSSVARAASTGASKDVGCGAGCDDGIAQRYAQLRGAGDGRPAYWVSRGIRYGQRDLDLIPMSRSVMISSVLFVAGADGAVVSRVLEAGISLALDGRSLVDEVPNPFAAGAVKLAHIAPMVISYVLSKDGRLQLPPDDPRRAATEFDGSVTSGTGFHRELAVDERFRSTARLPDGRVSRLAEEISYCGPAPRRPGAAALDTRKRMSVIRGWPYATSQAGAHSLFAVYDGLKLRSWEAAVAEVGAALLERVHPGFAARLQAFR